MAWGTKADRLIAATEGPEIRYATVGMVDLFVLPQHRKTRDPSSEMREAREANRGKTHQALARTCGAPEAHSPAPRKKGTTAPDSASPSMWLQGVRNDIPFVDFEYRIGAWSNLSSSFRAAAVRTPVWVGYHRPVSLIWTLVCLGHQ